MKHMKDVLNVFCNDAAHQFQVCPKCLDFEINSRNIKLNKTLKFEQEGEL